MKFISMKGGKMERKYVLTIMAVSLVAILGVGAVSAFGFGNGFFNSATDEEKAAMKENQDAMRTAIENNDYATWKTLMEGQIAQMQSKITEENFNDIVANHAKMSEMQSEMNTLRQKYGMESENPGMRGAGKGEGKCPFAE
ncbi:MAG: hypothetical protein WC438_00265 [Candidatus Pacearchaeota archaeon]